MEQAVKAKRRKRELSEAEIFEIRQLIASGVKNTKDYPEVMELNDSDEDEATAAMVHKPADEALEDFEACPCPPCFPVLNSAIACDGQVVSIGQRRAPRPMPWRQTAQQGLNPRFWVASRARLAILCASLACAGRYERAGADVPEGPHSTQRP